MDTASLETFGVVRYRLVAMCLESEKDVLAFVQPVGLNSVSGAGKLLRSLIAQTSHRYISVCTSLTAPSPVSSAVEIHLPLRPHFGRIESTRLGRYLYPIEKVYSRRFRRQLAAICIANKATAIHTIAHSTDFFYAYQVARQLRCKYFLTVHDDLGYALQGRLERASMMKELETIWNQADGRFVISEKMGAEYCKRYGDQPYEIVTDGLNSIPLAPLPRRSDQLNLYFMGLFHLSYEANLISLLQAIEIVGQTHPSLEISITCRCGSLPPGINRNHPQLKLFPFGPEENLASEMAAWDLLYLPLPFGTKYESFSRFSLSTKMVSYLGSGVPILYHGPRDSAAGELLATHESAFIANSLEPKVIAAELRRAIGNGADIARNGLELARSKFLAATQRDRFWNTVDRSLPMEKTETTARL